MNIKGTVINGDNGANKSIPSQKMELDKRGIYSKEYFNGTINIRLKPQKYELIQSDIICPKVKWNYGDYREEETISLIHIKKLIYKEKEYTNPGFIYFPEKSHHTKEKIILELLCIEIPKLESNTEIEIMISDDRLKLL